MPLLVRFLLLFLLSFYLQMLIIPLSLGDNRLVYSSSLLQEEESAKTTRSNPC
jgi:hypothetical protein